MLKVGLTGGFACGKSFVGRCLVDLGCHLLKADELGHAVLAPDGEAYRNVIEAFGDGILDENGLIDRPRLGSMVFSDRAKLERLNALVHPAVIAREEAWLATLPSDAIAVVEAAILIETGSYKRLQKLILVVCDTDQQVERAIARDSMSREDVLARIERQMSLAEKRKYADYVIDTSGEKAATIEQVERLYKTLRRL
jgi:dephospho-CoA kinase